MQENNSLHDKNYSLNEHQLSSDSISKPQNQPSGQKLEFSEEPLPLKTSQIDYTEQEPMARKKEPQKSIFRQISSSNLERWNKEGKWTAYEHLEYESAFFSFLPNCFFRIRNMMSRPFTFHPFKCCQFSLGEILLTILEVAIVASVGVVLILSDISNHDEDLGTFASILLALSFASASKNLVFHIFLGMPWERQVKFHKFMAFLGISVATAHGLIMGLGHDQWTTISGIVLASLMGATIVFSFFIFRRYCYALFYIFHILLAVAIIVFSVFHETTLVFIGVGFWGLDVLIRIILIARFAYKIEKTELYVMPGGIVRVEISPKANKRFYFRGGQYVLICIPKANIWEFHPISISNCSFNEKIVLHFKKVGPWTKKVFRTVDGTNKKTDAPLELKDSEGDSMTQAIQRPGRKIEATVFVNGPYGAPRVDIDSPRYKLVVLVAGGIGVTPMQSIYNELLIQHIRGRPFVKVKLVWALRDVGMLHTVAAHEDNFYDKADIDPSQIAKFEKCHLTNLRFSSVMEANFYLTKNASEDDAAELRKMYSANIHLGRPNYAQILQEMAELAVENGEHDVAVLSCGPSGMIGHAFKSSYERTRKYETSNGKDFKVNFDFHSEVFEF